VTSSEMNVCILEGNLDKAKEVGNRILSNANNSFVETCQINNYTNNVNSASQATADMNNNNSQFDFLNEQVNIV
jgi:hypothetical protein